LLLRPAGSPAACAVERLALLHEQAEHALEHLGRDAGALVLDRQPDRAVVARRLDGDPRLGAGVLRRVGEQVRYDLGEPVRIDVDEHAVARDAQLEPVAPLLEHRARDLEPARDDLGQLDAPAPQLDAAARDPRDVEQIVDEPAEVADLARQHLLLARRLAVAHAHLLECGDHRRERVAQLVTEHR
jgi:hypothetical protein